jgi:hypothetical protein
MLLLPLFGPLLDHHFAERQHDHVHVYPGRVTPDHAHPYEQPHSHFRDDRGTNGADDLPPDDSTPRDIVYLAS